MSYGWVLSGETRRGFDSLNKVHKMYLAFREWILGLVTAFSGEMWQECPFGPIIRIKKQGT